MQHHTATTMVFKIIEKRESISECEGELSPFFEYATDTFDHETIHLFKQLLLGVMVQPLLTEECLPFLLDYHAHCIT